MVNSSRGTSGRKNEACSVQRNAASSCVVSAPDGLSVGRRRELMNLARSTYYYRPHRRAKDEDALKHRTEAICDEFPRYGYRRVAAQLQHEGWRVDHKRVARIMRESGLSLRPRRRTAPTSDGGRGEAVFPNLARDFTPTGTSPTFARVAWAGGCGDGVRGGVILDRRAHGDRSC